MFDKSKNVFNLSKIEKVWTNFKVVSKYLDILEISWRVFKRLKEFWRSSKNVWKIQEKYRILYHSVLNGVPKNFESIQMSLRKFKSNPKESGTGSGWSKARHKNYASFVFKYIPDQIENVAKNAERWLVSAHFLLEPTHF